MGSSTFSRPSFVVGVSGHMDPQEKAGGEENSDSSVRARVRLVFDFLKHGAISEAGIYWERLEASLPHRRHAPGLREWTGLPHTPITVLSSLAPGADTIVAEAALEKGWLVQAPLPFTSDLYSEASTFVKNRRAPTGREKSSQAVLRGLLDRIGADNTYPVRLADETEIGFDELHARMLVDRDAVEPGRRHLRYQAAGEYIAAHCDLLLVLWDDNCDSGEPEGTGGIVRARLQGTTTDLLPSTNSFTWVNSGPVVHLYMPRRKNAAGIDPRKQEKIRWLHPGVPSAQPPPALLAAGSGFFANIAATWLLSPSDSGEQANRWREYEAWQATGNSRLCRLGRGLDSFNAGYRIPPVPTSPLCRMLDPGARSSDDEAFGPDTFADALRTQLPAAFGALAPLATARRHAADASNRKFRRSSRRALLGIFLLVFVFAAGLHLFSHWELREEGLGEIAAEHTDSGDRERRRGESARLCFGVISLLAGAASLGVFWWHRRNEVEERDQDYRALSEALRVQLAWCLAGLHRSAAAHYLERQRNELEWIRSVLSSLSMPYHRWSGWFSAADGTLQLRLLRWAHESWVGEQAVYHERRGEQHARNLHGLHRAGGVLALAGVWQVVFLVLDAWSPFLETDGFKHWSEVTMKCGEGAALLLFAVFCFLWGRASHRVRSKQRQAAPGQRAAAKTFLPTLHALMDVLVPAREHSARDSSHRRRWQMIAAFLLHLPLAAAIGTFAVAAAVGAQRWTAWPRAAALLTICSGILLLAGALLVAWGEKNLLSEQAHQFNSMASLFSAAESRLDELLTAAETSPPAERAVHIRRAQRMIYDLGVEALAENGEWLVLHRSRPMEPMMAG